MKTLYQYMKPFRVPIAIAIILKAVSTLFDLLIPFIMSYIIDVGIVNKDMRVIVGLAALMLLCTAIGGMVTVVAHTYSIRGAQRTGEALRNRLFEHIQKLTIQDIDELSTASLITRVTNDVEHIQRTVMMISRMMVRGPLIMIGSTVMALFLDVQLTLIIFGAMLVLLVISMLSYTLTQKIYRQAKKKLDELTAAVRDNLTGIKVIKVFAKTEEEVDHLDAKSKEVKDLELKAGYVNAYISPSVRIVINIGIVILLCLGGMRVDRGEVAIGEVITILNYMNMVLGAMMTIPRMFMMFSHATTSASRIEDVLGRQTYTVYGEVRKPLESGEVLAFDNVGFHYPQTTERALKGIRFKVHKGETVAVIGTTGAGKTSIVNLILRLYEPSEGTILFQGRPIASYDKAYLTEKITAAMQQYSIFSMSIAENIVLDQPVEDERLWQAVQVAQMEDLLESVADKYEHRVTQNGTNLSGGQKQRMSIARTLYRQSDLVILDDVASALDYKTDLKLRRALQEKYKEQAVILISQRISSVRHADKILVLEKGEQVGFGTHQELVKTCEVYQNICALQERKEVMGL